MHFEDFNAFLAMGGYGAYVWLSFGMGVLSIAVIWGDSILAKRKLFTQILTEQARQQRIKAASSPSNVVEK